MRLPRPAFPAFVIPIVSLLAFAGDVTPIPAGEPANVSSTAGSRACWPQNQNSCITIQSHTFTPSTQAPDVGPFTYTITIANQAFVSRDASIGCVDLSPQLPCTTPSPEYVTLPPGGTQVVTVGYTTLGLGVFSQKHVVTDEEAALSVQLTVGQVTVSGVPIATHMNPLDSAELWSYDTLKVALFHPSGISTATTKLYVDNVDRTSQATVTTSAITATASALGLSGGFHAFYAYACATNGRCDNTPTTTFYVPGSVASNLDDSLGLPFGDGIAGVLPGALPLPPDTLKGCPVDQGHPMIKLSEQFSYIEQLVAPVGIIFRADVNFDTTVAITTVNYDYVASDTTTCDSFDYLTPSQYNWNFWADPSDTDPLWDVYPYGDFTPPGGGISPMSAPTGGTGPGGGNGKGNGGGGGHGGGHGGGGGGIGTFALGAGAMNPDSVRVWLNGTLIINNGSAVPGKGVTIISEDPVQYRYKVTVATGVAQGFIHMHNPGAPSSDNGGWNELVLAGADSTGHWTKVRSRFVQGQSQTTSPLVVTPLRDFRHQGQEDCAAFGALQCAGVTLVQGIPGFVTRDKDRSLHLVYRSASQRAKTVLPYDVYVSRLQRAPDSVNISLRESGVVVSDTQHYYGRKRASGIPAGEMDTLWENANERRVIAAALPAPGTGTNAAIRTITAWVRSFYGSSPTFQDDTVRREVAQLHLSDTTTSRFGPGWTLAEQSRLITLNSSTRTVWLSGDGSYVVFNKVGSVWVAPPGETARLKDTTISSATRVVFLDNGARIGYNASGWQLWTSDIIGNLTQYKYNATSQRLDSIVDPTGIRYEFVYSGATTGQVSEIWIKGTGGATQKMASFAYDGSRRMTVAKVWRSASAFDSTVFAYHATAPGAFITTVTDPRSTASAPIVTSFTYDTLYWMPTTIVRPPDRYGQATAQYRDPLRRAIPRAGRGRSQALAERMIYFPWYKGTYQDFTGRQTEVVVDRFGGPTLVTALAPPGFMTPDFLVMDWGGNDVRRIDRDSMGRVTKIVGGDPAHLMQDSVMYTYDPLGPVSKVIRTTAAHPVTVALDTTAFTYDTAKVTSTQGRCTRLLTMRDAMAGITQTVYGASGVGQCLPTKTIGLAQDTTIFTYGALTAGDVAGARPISVRDPIGITATMQYNAQTWNSAVGIRVAAADTSRSWYNPYGWVDSVKAGDTTRTYYQYDQSGRVLRAKTGKGALAPTTATFYNRSGLTDSVRVYPSGDAELETVLGTVQTTKYFYNRLGWVDSTIYPGGRRQQFLRGRDGNPIYEFPGNGSFTGRAFDWQGRLLLENPSAIGPDYRVNGDSFATRVADSVYRSLGMRFNVTLSSGQVHQYTYDNRGRVTEIRTRDVGTSLTDLLVRRYSYGPAGQMTQDVLTFVRDGLTVTRNYEYNRRGQRTLARSSLSVTSGTLLEANDSLRYIYDAATARLDSLVGWADSTAGSWRRFGAVRWLYDRAGRDTLQRVTPWTGGTGGGSVDKVLSTRTTYDAAGRVSLISTSSAGGTWYSFSSPTYSKVDDLLSASITEPSGTAPSNPLTSTSTYTYAANGTRRLQYSSTRTGTNSYTFDVFGNDTVEAKTSVFVPDCSGNGSDHVMFGTDNAITRTLNSCVKTNRYWNDKSGNRLVQLDSTGSVYNGVQSIMSYTASNQLFFSMTPTALPGTYDYNWHWYDAAGRRMISQVQTGLSWVPITSPPTSGNRTFYVYDGSDVALAVVKSGSAWWVKARYITGGVDNNIAGRFRNLTGNSTQNLALVNDRQGSTLTAMRANGTNETQAQNFSTDPYGGLVGASGTGGTMSTGSGFTGASTPNSSGGFVYLRNRWYDPKTGRFLTQDPIGLAGGVNLYSYAGNNPIAFDDPFGLECRDNEIKTLREAVRCIGVRAGKAGEIVEAVWAIETMVLPIGSGAGIITKLALGERSATAAANFGRAASGTVRARVVGEAGEASSGVVKNTQRIESATGAAFRVPDGLNPTTLTEVKNASGLSLTNQIRDFAEYARRTQRKMTLVVRRGTRLSGPLQDYIRENGIQVRFLP